MYAIIRVYWFDNDARLLVDEYEGSEDQYEAVVAVSVPLERCNSFIKMIKSWLAENNEKGEFVNEEEREKYFNDARKIWETLRKLFEEGEYVREDRFTRPEHLRLEVIEEDEGWVNITVWENGEKHTYYYVFLQPYCEYNEEKKCLVFGGKPLTHRNWKEA